MTMKLKPSIALALLGLTGLSLLAGTPASAGVTTITGGDTGEGFAPLSDVYFALAAYNSAGGTVQNVTFDFNTAGNFTVNSFIGDAASGGPLGSGTYFPIVSTNDTSLDGILSHGLFGQRQTVLLTLSGLTVGKVYQVDSLVSTIGGGPRDETVTATGLTSFTDTGMITQGGTTSPGGALNFTQTLVPDASGKINLSYASTSGFPLLSGLVISSGLPSAAPEPSQIAGLGFAAFGVLGLLLKARRSRHLKAIRAA